MDNQNKNSGWISINDRLPATRGKYIVAFHPCYWDDVEEEMRVGVDSYCGGGRWVKSKYQRVTHWQPFPEPPTLEKEENQND